jgi:hypothetical protein
MLSFKILVVVKLNTDTLSVMSLIILSAILLSVVILSLIILTVVILNVVILSVVMLKVAGAEEGKKSFGRFCIFDEKTFKISFQFQFFHDFFETEKE